MDGADRLNATMPQHRRALWLPDGAVMNRYWDDRPAPRPESYKEDYETAAEQANKEDTYRHLKAGAESGWDFSSRWFADGKSIKTIQTTHIIPVDLNCLMWHLETLIAKGHELKGDSQKAAFFAQKAAKRAAAIQKYCYQADKKWYFDYHWKNNSATPVASLAGFFPLFFHMTDPKQAKECIQTLTEKFVRPGGLVTTENNTGQQWDAPNGWAPLQWIGIVGLRNYEATQLADELKKRWVALNTKVYARTGKMMEKYNVEDLSLDAGGGEYPVQDGFGWTNGVLLRLLSERQ